MSEGNDQGRAGGRTFWKIAAAGAAFQAGSSAVDSATIVASLVNHLTGSVYAVGAASAVLRLGWLLPQTIVGFLAQRAERSMPFYVVGAFGRAGCLTLIAVLLVLMGEPSGVAGLGFLVLWTLYAFISGIVAVPYNDIVGRSIVSEARSRMLAWRFFCGGALALGVAGLVHRLLETLPVLTAYAATFVIAAALMLVSSAVFVSAGEPEPTRKKGTTADGYRAGFVDFLKGGVAVLMSDRRFRIFLFTQWLSGTTVMALPFYVVAATNVGIGVEDVAILLGAQTAGSLASNAAWGQLGDRRGKLWLLQAVSVLRFVVPIAAIALFALADLGGILGFAALILFFVLVGALVNGMTIGYLGYLMEISPDDRRPAYSAYFNAFASPAALLPLFGALLVDAGSFDVLFAVAAVAAVAQLLLLRRLAKNERGFGP